MKGNDTEAETRKAERRDQKFGGRNRWVFTTAFLGTGAFTVWSILRHNGLVVLFVPMAIIHGIFAIINWYAWIKKSPAERATIRPFIYSFTGLNAEIGSLPFTRAEYTVARNALASTMLCCVFFLLPAFSFVASACMPHRSFVARIALGIIGFGCTLIFLHFGRRYIRVAKALSCPDCRDLLTSQGDYIPKTGKCRKCGRVIIPDLAMPPAHPTS
jgi:hypothetical protein